MFRIRIRPLWNGGSCFECHSKSQWHVAEWQESLCRKIRTPQGTWSRTWWKSSQIHQCLHQEHQWWVRRNQTYRFVWKIWKNQLRQGNYTTWLNHSVETEEFSVTYQNVLEVKLWQKNSSFSTLCCIYVRFDHQMCPFSLGKFLVQCPPKPFVLESSNMAVGIPVLWTKIFTFWEFAIDRIQCSSSPSLLGSQSTVSQKWKLIHFEFSCSTCISQFWENLICNIFL